MSRASRVAGRVVGAVQPPDIQHDIPAALRIICEFMARADHHGVNFLCFPECFLQGYTLDAAETKQRALSLRSPEFQAILERLAGFETTAIIGVIEEDNGAYYNTAAVIKQGKLLGSYRKVHLFEKNFQPGIDYPVFTVDGLTFGINICYDARFADGAAALAGQGAKVIFYLLSNRWPTRNAKKYRYKHIPNLVDRSMENDCWVVSSDITHQGDTTIAYGCGAIIAPEGDVITRVPELEVGFTSYRLPHQL